MGLKKGERGSPRSEVTKQRISAALLKAYEEGRHSRAFVPQNLAGFNAAIRNGRPAPWRKIPHDQLAVDALVAAGGNYTAAGRLLGVTREAIKKAIRRMTP